LIEIVFFNVVGYMIGSYIEKKNEQRLSAEKTSRELQEAYQKLTQNTERVMQLEEELRFADRLALMGELSASFAHEIRNPLGGIQGAAEILSKAIPEQNQNHEFVQIQLAEIKRLNQVVENYLSLSGAEVKSFSAYNLVDIIASIRDLIQLSARQHRVDLVFNAHDKDGLWIYGDLIRLRQAFLNIALNGIHAMPEGGTLKFIVEPFPDDQKVRITVRDTGKGIPQSIREKIFDPFFSTREKGSGLGLTIARRIIEDHQGQITFESNGQGTAFFIELPLNRVNADG
jgi:signal transduction histidine kinase